MTIALIGGFLGSGKTTAIVRACQHLMQANKNVGVITNDQGEQQVDSAYVQAFGIPAREVSNGCFCCNYNQLDERIRSLEQAGLSCMIFAESVGSCSDLVATIAKPFHQFNPETKVVISVFADAELMVALLEDRASFLEETVRYIYKKQLEETDLLIVNKTDLISQDQLRMLREVLQREYSRKTILYQSAFNDDNIIRWLRAMDDFVADTRSSLVIDYDQYAQGEAELAWLDKRIEVHTNLGNAVFVTEKIIGNLFDRIQQDRLAIGHLKFFVEGDGWCEKVSFTTASSGEMTRLPFPETNLVTLLINARVQTESVAVTNLVEDVIDHAMRTFGCVVVKGKWSAFKPGYPRPTHRMG